MGLLWVLPAVVAATFDTLADVISDEVVAGEDDFSSEEEDEEQAKKLRGGSLSERPRRPCCCPVIETKHKLTGEQDFMVSMVPMVCASVAIAAAQPAGTLLHSPLALAQSDLGPSSTTTILGRSSSFPNSNHRHSTC